MNSLPTLEFGDWIQIESAGNIPVLRIVMEHNSAGTKYIDIRTSLGYINKSEIIEVRGVNGKFWKRSL